MMKKFFLFLMIPILIQSKEPFENDFSIAPLMPLVPGDPLELNLKLRQALYDQDQSDKNRAIFKSYTIPWISILFLLLLAILAPFFLLVLRQMEKNKAVKTTSFRALIDQMKKLQDSTLSSKELIFEVAKLFRMSFEKGIYMTYQELFLHIKENNRFTSDQLNLIQVEFQKLEKLQYSKEQPSYKEVRDIEQSLNNISPFKILD